MTGPITGKQRTDYNWRRNSSISIPEMLKKQKTKIIKNKNIFLSFLLFLNNTLTWNLNEKSDFPKLFTNLRQMTKPQFIGQNMNTGYKTNNSWQNGEFHEKMIRRCRINAQEQIGCDDAEMLQKQQFEG